MSSIMVKKRKLLGVTLALLCVIAVALPAQEEGEGSNLDFGLDLELGAQTFNEVNDSGETTQVTYQSLSLNPDIGFGPFGIGLAVTVHYRFNAGEEGNSFAIREEDWVPTGDTTFLELYLPMFRYVRWGQRGEPIYAKLGSIDDATLGNGFIMGNYSNTHFLPEKRIFGLTFDLDGRLFKFPYVGFQSFVGNLAHFDVMGGRLFGRPLLWLDVPIIKNLEIGATLAADIDPYYHTDTLPTGVTEGEADEASVQVFGADFKLPILGSQIVSLAAFGDYVVQNQHTGGMIGFGGALFGFLPYGFQLRILGENFLPAYFGDTYDLYRTQYYTIANATDTTYIESSAGWFANTGFSFLEDKISFSLTGQGPFGKPAGEDPDPDQEWVNYPRIDGRVAVEEGLIPGFSFEATLERRNIQSFSDLIDLSEAIIGATVNYQTGPAVITLAYDVSFNPNTGEWETSAQLQSSLSLF